MSLNGLMTLTCSFFGVLAFLAPLISRLNFRSGISIALDFWMAAGLIRLSGVPSWSAILTAAVLIVIRKLTHLSLSRLPISQAGSVE